MASLKTKFGRAIRKLRDEAGYSQESFADAIGVHRTYMGTIERGRGNPTLEMIARIARGLRVSLSTLFEAVEKEPVAHRRRSEPSREVDGNPISAGTRRKDPTHHVSSNPRLTRCKPGSIGVRQPWRGTGYFPSCT